MDVGSKNSIDSQSVVIPLPSCRCRKLLPRVVNPWDRLVAYRVIASMSPDDTAAALRLLKVLEECRRTSAMEAEASA